MLPDVELSSSTVQQAHTAVGSVTRSKQSTADTKPSQQYFLTVQDLLGEQGRARKVTGTLLNRCEAGFAAQVTGKRSLRPVVVCTAPHPRFGGCCKRWVDLQRCQYDTEVATLNICKELGCHPEGNSSQD